MAACSREWDYEESSVEYESEKTVINYTSDSNDTSFEASTTGYAHEPEYTACELKNLLHPMKSPLLILTMVTLTQVD